MSILWPTPVFSRCAKADKTPIAAHIPVVWSPIATPTLRGPDSGLPVTLINPEYPWAIWSNPGWSELGPSLPNPVMLI